MQCNFVRRGEACLDAATWTITFDAGGQAHYCPRHASRRADAAIERGEGFACRPIDKPPTRTGGVSP